MEENSWEQWCELCDYVKEEIMGYGKDMKLPKFIALRLKGLSEGKFIANKNIKNAANYSYRVIFLTFKAKKSDILMSFKRNEGNFKDEQHRFNYCMTIIENSINDIVLRLENMKKNEEKMEVIEIDKGQKEVTYKKKEVKENKYLEDLW